jgi:hypothetical protein
MHHVRDFTKELSEFYEERVKIEQRYAKDLLALSKKVNQTETFRFVVVATVCISPVSCFCLFVVLR